MPLLLLRDENCPPCPICNCNPESSKKNLKPDSSKSTRKIPDQKAQKQKGLQQGKTKSGQQRDQKLASKGEKGKQSKAYQKGKAQDENKKGKDGKLQKEIEDQPKKIKSEKFPVIMQIKDVPDIINWIKSIPYTRRLSFIPRDFADGVLIAETVKYFLPQAVDLHNYASANGRANKILNWKILNRKVFSQFGFQLKMEEIEEIVMPKRFNTVDSNGLIYPIEQFLFKLKNYIGKYTSRVNDYKSKPTSSQNTQQLPLSTKLIIRPLSRQPISSVMRKLEIEAGAKYGAYNGNPIAWDFLPELNDLAELELAAVGISKQRYKEIKLKGRELLNNKKLQHEDVSKTQLPIESQPQGKICQAASESFGISPNQTRLEPLRPSNVPNIQKTQATQVRVHRGELKSSGGFLNEAIRTSSSKDQRMSSNVKLPVLVLPPTTPITLSGICVN